MNAHIQGDNAHQLCVLQARMTHLSVPARITKPSRFTFPSYCTYAQQTHLWPIHSQGIHIQDIQPAREALVERLQRVAESPQSRDIRMECVRLVGQLCERGFEEAETIGRIRVVL